MLSKISQNKSSKINTTRPTVFLERRFSVIRTFEQNGASNVCDVMRLTEVALLTTKISGDDVRHGQNIFIWILTIGKLLM